MIYSNYELIGKLIEADKSEYEFCDILDLSNALDRHLHLNDVEPSVGDVIESYIRFFNRYDEEQNIPIEEREPIKLFIDSPGGDLVSAFTIIDAIRLSKTPVWTINIGAAYSAGFFIYIAGHERYAYPLSSFLFHEGSVATGADAAKFRNFADFYKEQLETMKGIVLKLTSISEEQYELHLKDDWWINAEKALELGICDTIVNSIEEVL